MEQVQLGLSGMERYIVSQLMVGDLYLQEQLLIVQCLHAHG